jgi:hypothetical protein
MTRLTSWFVNSRVKATGQVVNETGIENNLKIKKISNMVMGKRFR